MVVMDGFYASVLIIVSRLEGTNYVLTCRIKCRKLGGMGACFHRNWKFRVSEIPFPTISAELSHK